jgi:mono/diheme cytochrome c family protein
MKKINELLIIISIFVLLLAACGTAAKPAVSAPTARPYTAMELPPPYENSEQIVGNLENGQALYLQYCGQCYATEQNEL